MKKCITILAISLVCHGLIAEVTRKDFKTIDDLIAFVKQDDFGRIVCDTNGSIVGLRLPFDCTTDSNLRLLSKIKSIKYLHISGSFTAVSTNGIKALAEWPNLTGLCIVCGGGKHLDSALPCVTNLQSLELAQNAYETNDTVYLAKMTNLVSLHIAGSIPKTKSELQSLTNLVHLQKLFILGSDENIKNLDAGIFSRFENLTTLLITSELDVYVAAIGKRDP